MLEDNLTIERRLPAGLGLSVSYVGVRGYDIFTVKDGNPEIPTIVNGTYFWAANAPRVNPHFGSIELVTTAGDSWYNALQVVVAKQMSHGLQFQETYTWSKSLDTTESATGAGDGSAPGCAITTNPVNTLSDKGPSCFDVPQVFHLNLLYNLPNIRSNSNSFAAQLVHGWWIANVVTAQTGTPFTPIIGYNRSQSDNLVVGGHGNEHFDLVSVNTRALIAANPCTPSTCAYTPVPFNQNSYLTNVPDPSHNGIDRFNPAMFNIGTVGTLGNAARGILLGPGFHDWDFTLAKETPLRFLGETGRLTFRAEFFNILNITNYGEPGGGGNNSGKTFNGSTNDVGPFSEAPVSTGGYLINSTIGIPRHIQLSLKLLW